jgi:hypothetical protein
MEALRVVTLIAVAKDVMLVKCPHQSIIQGYYLLFKLKEHIFSVCSCQVCQTSYQPFVFRQQYLPRIYEPPLINYQTRYLPPMVQRYPLNNIGCQSCGMSNYPHTGLPGQISPFPKPPNRMNQMFKPVGNYALPYSGYRTSPYASYPNSILPALQNLAVGKLLLIGSGLVQVKTRFSSSDSGAKFWNE